MWIEKDNGYKYAYLLMVTTKNNNKYYEMEQINDSQFQVTYGRVEVTATKRTYGIGLWERKYREKERKGYKCMTEMHAIPESNSQQDTNTIDHDEPIVRSIFQRLQQAASGTVRANYTASVHAVTQTMIDDAQDKLNSLASCVTSHDFTRFNDHLLDLFHIIPRRMSQVNDHLLALSNADILSKAKEIVGDEQDLLDTMSGQVSVVAEKKHKDKTGLLAAMGIDVRGIADHEKQLILKLMNDQHRSYDQRQRFLNAVAVNNRKTEHAFDNFLTAAIHKDTELLWHGSRTQNWVSILQKGLVLYPTSAIITGKMFGLGLYFANRAKKSIGYSSARGSYWTQGNDPQGYIALYQVHMGNPWVIHRHKREYEQLKKPRDGYDCVFAKGGYDLQNDEIIIYNQAQCTVRYIVEIK